MSNGPRFPTPEERLKADGKLWLDAAIRAETLKGTSREGEIPGCLKPVPDSSYQTYREEPKS